jgi:hypothetical protein
MCSNGLLSASIALLSNDNCLHRFGRVGCAWTVRPPCPPAHSFRAIAGPASTPLPLARLFFVDRGLECRAVERAS